jgi:diguanylate cyclase (GGDEF)-like protein/PAS domain S-box-containing protein
LAPRRLQLARAECNTMTLSEFIRTHVDAILDAWENFAQDTTSGQELDVETLRDHAIGILHTIADDLDQVQSPQQQREKSLGRAPRPLLTTEAEMHGAARVSAGFTVNEAMAEYRALRASVLQLWSEANPVAVCNAEVTRFNEAIDQALSESLGRFSGQKAYHTRMFDAILSASPDLNYIVRADGRLIYANMAFATLYGCPLNQVAGKNLFALCGVGAQQLRQDVAKVIDSKQTLRGEMTCAPAGGGAASYECLLIPVLDEAGQVEAVAGTARDITERKLAQERAARFANYDSLTELPNRNLFRDRLEHEIKRSERSDVPLALLFIDLDGFKDVNDRLGHAAGDALLREAARRIHACVRHMDTVARLGGDEFTVILAEVNKISHVEILAQHILAELSKPFPIGGNEVQVSGSIGITMFPQDAHAPQELLKNADQAMYAAKNAGRNRFSFFTASMRDAAWARLKVIDELRLALPHGQLCIHYQPIVDLATGDIVKAEAQLRWRHPNTGMLRPADFIALAEETGLIGEIGAWVMREALAQANTWSALRGAPFQVCVHKGAAEFMNRSGNGWDRDSAARDRIAIEINEEVLLKDTPVVRNRIAQLNKAGIALTVDNFGIGYASMSYLKKYGVDYLKIDQSFIHAVTNDAQSRIFAESIIAMAHKLGVKVIAQSVETAGQKDWLKTAGCDYAQGYLFSEALPPQLFEQLLH